MTKQKRSYPVGSRLTSTEYGILLVLAKLEDRKVSDVIRRLIVREGKARQTEIEIYRENSQIEKEN